MAARGSQAFRSSLPRMARLTLIMALLALPALAQPLCTPANEGQLACIAGKLCACRFERGGSLIGRPDRFAWDCGVLRPSCAPSDAPQPPVELPPGLTLIPSERRPWR